MGIVRATQSADFFRVSIEFGFADRELELWCSREDERGVVVSGTAIASLPDVRTGVSFLGFHRIRFATEESGTGLFQLVLELRGAMLTNFGRGSFWSLRSADATHPQKGPQSRGEAAADGLHRRAVGPAQDRVPGSFQYLLLLVCLLQTSAVSGSSSCAEFVSLDWPFVDQRFPVSLKETTGAIEFQVFFSCSRRPQYLSFSCTQLGSFCWVLIS